ncbi:hypothetical protein AB0P36_21880 [Streptomyces flavidovirens]|uniref:hypothetical protein n=1 Tax=Streptomyces flavidovirens TaxID=67298 RepID=UPI003433FE5F
MPALIRERVATLAVVAITSLILNASLALADDPLDQVQPPPNDASGNADGQELSATAGGVVFDRSKNGKGTTAGPVAAVGNWTPPACWYAPKYTPAQFKKYVEPIWAAESTGAQWDLEQRKRYVDGEPYKDFNADKAGKGYWWDSYINEARIGEPGALACDKPTFWVDNGDPPPADVPEAVTPEILAHLAYAEVRVPDTEIELAPKANTKVNLPTWAWLDKAEFNAVSVTASVPVLNIQATATATPVSLKIEPGTKDAALHPASGECPIQDGSIGVPYTQGSADQTPPCGLTYLRSSGDGTYKLQATITWKMHWTGTGGAGGDLPDGTFGTTQNITVQEIQAINR